MTILLVMFCVAQLARLLVWGFTGVVLRRKCGHNFFALPGHCCWLGRLLGSAHMFTICIAGDCSLFLNEFCIWEKLDLVFHQVVNAYQRPPLPIWILHVQVTTLEPSVSYQFHSCLPCSPSCTRCHLAASHVFGEVPQIVGVTERKVVAIYYFVNVCLSDNIAAAKLIIQIFSSAPILPVQKLNQIWQSQTVII